MSSCSSRFARWGNKPLTIRLLDQKDPLRAMNGYFLALLALLPYTPADASMMTYHQAVFTGLPQL